MKSSAFLKSLILCLLLLLAPCTQLLAEQGGEPFDERRNRLIGLILAKQLPALHYSDKRLDDSLAADAFFLYIKQLDFQKRFLLAEDVHFMEGFAKLIDDNLVSGRIQMPKTGFDLLSRRIDQVQALVEEMLVDRRLVRTADGQRIDKVGIFAVNQPEMHETDQDKLEFAKTSEELSERWRLILKGQIISEFLDLQRAQEKGVDKKAGKGGGEKKSDEDLWGEALEKISKRNLRFFQRLRKETMQDHYDRFFNCVARAFDPHTNYVPPASKEQFDINMRGSLEGIGALLREEDGFIKVVRIIPGSASARQGKLKAEDIILEVAQEDEEPVDISEMRLRDAVRLIRGPKGEAVTLTVKKPDGLKESIRIIRDVVQIEETFVKSTIVESADGRMVGYIFIPSFYRDFEGSRGGQQGRNSTDDTRQEILQLVEKGVDGIVLDLRDDGGGALVDAVDISGLFIETGPIVQVRNSFGDTKILRDDDPKIYYDGPLVVLVNKFSASASEIVAAAMQDYRRAVVVGSNYTHGKGTVQTIINLNDNIPLLHLRRYDDLGALKVMIQKFYRVNGSSTQWKGVTSDIILPDLFGHVKSGERYLDFSLPWDSIEPVPFTPWSDKAIDLQELRAASEERTAGDEGMQVVSEEAARAMERSQETQVSLDLGNMRETLEEAVRSKERIAAHYRRYQDDTEEEGERRDEPDRDAKEVWLEEVNQDPYVREAVMILSDMIRLEIPQ